MSFFVTAGQQYTFTFTESISLIDEVKGIGSVVSDAIINAGFPVSGTKWTAFFGSVDFNFTYTGADTDNDSLGQAMLNAINESASGTWTFAGAVQGIPNVNPSTPGAQTTNSVIAALPSPTTLGIGVVAIVLLALFVFSFGQGLGKGVA